MQNPGERTMALKKPAPKKTDADQPVHICFERIVPDDLDPEVNARRNLRGLMIARESGTLNADEVANVARIALINSKKWSTGAVLKCRFLDGSSKMRKGVEAIAHQWEQHAKIKFKFVSSGTAEIRISFFADAGSWSAVGRDATNMMYFPLHQPTMNYGWLRDSTPAAEYSRVVLHEFGHALGCIHEHQQPKFDRVWNKQAVLQYFQGPPNFWSPADIEHNVLAKYSPKGITATQFDPKSIMLYAFDGALFSDGKGPTNNNTKLSAYDVKLIKSMYS
jgi:serralysin